ncbi:MAG: hypothetical protein IJN76_04410 [Clostridia bacterium]|nr:hypothetical protein [Clostridia bacterium]
MKHFRKVCSVLLAMLMVAVVLPSTGLIDFESTPSVDAAEAGVLINGGFESGYTSTPHSSGSDSYNKINEGWTQNEWATTVVTTKQAGSYGIEITGHNSVANATAVEQIVPVNTNATYSLTFYVKGRSYKVDCNTVYNTAFTYSLDLGTTSSSFDTSVANKAEPSISGTSWTKVTATINTGSNKYLRIRLIAKGDDNGVSHADSFVLTATNAGDTGTHAKPSLTGWGTEKNRPSASSDNVVVQPGFESTTNAQWNTTDFLKQGVSVVTSGGTDGDAHSGSQFLKYYHGSVAYTDWPMFEITCPSAGEYVFSAWVRTPLLSATNVGAASIGIIDRDTNKFLTYGNAGGSYDGHFSNPETQLRSTATDDDWHLRSVTFYVGAANSNINIGIYGLKSTMYIDDISVHLLSKGVQYTGDQTGTLSASTSVSNKYCESENSLISDSGMTGNVAKEFWTKAASGWNNGFLEFAKDPQNGTRGNTLHFKGTSPASNKKYRYIKFVSVEPNTAYTVSFDYRVVTAGNQLTFIDNNIVKNATFHTPSLGSASNSWKTYAFTFNTGNYNRIGIVFQDGSGEAYFDDFRFFKNSDGISTEPEEELFPTLKPEHPDEFVSRKEMTDDKLGLAFMFNLKSTGVIREDRGFIADYTNGKVEAFEDGVQYTLKYAGAVMTNDATVGQDAALFTRENTNSGKTVIDVTADKLYYNPQVEGELGYGTDIYFAMRIINIPESHISTQIYARPYYVFDYNGREVVVYGDIVNDCYKSYPNINDGWLEWD